MEKLGNCSNAALVRLVGAHVCIHASMSGMRMAAPLFALREGYGAFSVGLLLALFGLVQMCLALPAGRFADKYGLTLPVSISVFAAIAGAAIAVVFPMFPVLCVSAILTGGATGAAAIAIQRHVGRASTGPEELRRAFSWLSLGPGISNFIGPFLAGILIDFAGPGPNSVFGYRTAFLLMSFLPLASWFLVRCIREPPSARFSRTTNSSNVWNLLRQPRFRRLMIVNWFLSSCWDVHTFIVPVLGFERNISASVVGSILGAFAVATSTVRMLMPFVAEHLREWAMLTAAMLTTAVLFFIYPLTQTAFGMAICSILLGFSLGSAQPMIMSLLHQVTPVARHGEALGLRLLTISASSVVIPLLFGTMGAVIGITGLFWATGAVVAAGSRAGWLLRNHP